MVGDLQGFAPRAEQGPGGLIVFAHSQTATVDVQNADINEHDLYRVPIPGGVLLPGRELQVQLWGDILRNAASEVDFRLRLGNTVVFLERSFLSASASRQIHYYEAWIYIVSLTQQVAFGRKPFDGTNATGITLFGPTMTDTITTLRSDIGMNFISEPVGAGVELALTAQWTAVVAPTTSARALGVRTEVYA